MRIPVDQIAENGWTRTVEFPLQDLKRVVETFGPQTGSLRARVVLKNHQGCIDVRGELVADLKLSCGICLEDGSVRVEVPLEVMVAPQAQWEAGHRAAAHEEVRLSVTDLDVSFYEGDELDLTQVLEDELLIAAPERLSEEDEEGNCSVCHRNVEAVLEERQATVMSDAAAFHPFREMAGRMKQDLGKLDPKKRN